MSKQQALSPIVPRALWEKLRAAGYLVRGCDPAYYWVQTAPDGSKRRSPGHFTTPHLCALDAQRDMATGQAWVQPALFAGVPMRYAGVRR